ncbi:MAG: hypothetical protein R2849_03505 [Thermomicrobiales bacterium]
MILFFLIAVAGLLLLAVSVIVGELFEFLDMGDLFDAGDLPGDSGGPITTPAISLGLTAFGATGMVTSMGRLERRAKRLTSFSVGYCVRSTRRLAGDHVLSPDLRDRRCVRLGYWKDGRSHNIDHVDSGRSAD